MSDPRRGPALFDDGDLGAGPADPFAAPPPPEAGAAPDPAALRALRAAEKGGGGLSKLFWGAALSLFTMFLGVAAWDFVANLIARFPPLGWAAAALTGALVLALVLFILRELAATARLGRVEATRAAVEAALRGGDRKQAVAATRRLARLYAGRPDMAWALAELREREPEILDGPALVEHAEKTLMKPLDAAAEAAVAKAARVVAGATALIPLALVDVLAALAANLRMIRAIAEIYGGRAGWLGSWRLLRAVAGHLLATGAVAVGDDLIQAAVGGGMAARLSRRFGEGLLNGALTARVGVAAIEVCRPAPHRALPKPSARGLVGRALGGLFSCEGRSGAV
jgi:putative membrane protein